MADKDKNIWQTIESIQKKYIDLKLSDMVDYEKYYIYSIISHSTAIEGSTLTELDTQLLLDEGITKKGNLFEHFMNIDLKNAYDFARTQAKAKTPITPELLIEFNALVMENTGVVMDTSAGRFDSGKGEFRLCGVRAGLEGRSYMNFRKIPDKVRQLCEELNKNNPAKKTLEEIYNFSFDAHFYLVTIHPWLDGNGRTARLLMNYIQFYHKVLPTKVYQQDRHDYIRSLSISQEEESPARFREFMAKQHLKNLKKEISNYEKSQGRNERLNFLF